MGPPGGPGTFVENLAALRVLDATVFTAGYIAYVAGHTTVGDGGGGLFYYAPASAAVDNNGTIVEPANTIGRWLRLDAPPIGESGTIKVEWFGNTGDFGARANAAIDVVRTTGGAVTWAHGGTATTPIDATGITKGLIFQSLGGNLDFPILVIQHVGVGIDCTGSCDLVFRDVMLEGSPTTPPKVGWLLAREDAGSSGARIRFEGNSGTTATSKFTVAALYDYAAEEVTFFGSNFCNIVAGAKTAIFTANNISAVASPFVTIETGAQSMAVINIFGGRWENRGGALSDVFGLDGVNDWHMWGGFSYCPDGRAQVFVWTANQASDLVTFNGTRFEIGAPRPDYIFFFDNTAAKSHVMWSVTGCRMDADVSVLYASDNSTIYTMHWEGNNDVNDVGVSVFLCRDSFFDFRASGKFTGRAGGAVTRTEIWAARARITMTATGYLNRYHYMDTAGDVFEVNATTTGPIQVALLAANAGSTVVPCPTVNAASRIFLTPVSATAAADQGSATGVWVSAKSAGVSFTITHPNNANADKEFNFWVVN